MEASERKNFVETWTDPNSHSTVTFRMECTWDGETLNLDDVVQVSEGGNVNDVPDDYIESIRKNEERSLQD